MISKEIRDRLGVMPGWIAVQRVVEDHVEVYFLPPEHNRSLKGILAGRVADLPPEADWGHIKEKAWRRAAKERIAGEELVEIEPKERMSGGGQTGLTNMLKPARYGARTECRNPVVDRNLYFGPF